MQLFYKHIPILILSFISLTSAAQEPAQATSETPTEEPTVTILPPLFEYPVVPDEITDWQERSNWLVEHFWDALDLKQKAVGQAQLNHAFKTWIVPMRFADGDVVLKSVDKLLSKLQKNPGLLLQFTMAAERNIYDPLTADAIIDDVYLPFLTSVTSCKKLPDVRKARYKAQLSSLQGSRVGDQLKNFEFMSREGEKTKFIPNAKYTMIEFGDPDCSECRILRLRLETDDTIQNAATSGQLQIYFIIPDIAPDDTTWRDLVKDYQHFWTVGAAEGLDEEIDLRYTPCIYLVDSTGKIVLKNATLQEIRDFVSQQ